MPDQLNYAEEAAVMRGVTQSMPRGHGILPVRRLGAWSEKGVVAVGTRCGASFRGNERNASRSTGRNASKASGRSTGASAVCG